MWLAAMNELLLGLFLLATLILWQRGQRPLSEPSCWAIFLSVDRQGRAV